MTESNVLVLQAWMSIVEKMWTDLLRFPLATRVFIG